MSKLHHPWLGRSVIDRTWLLERSVPDSPEAPDPGADHGSPGVVTLLSAPAGAGKTTLMSSWAENRASRGERVAWLSLDAHDNDPVLFWTGLLAATAHTMDDHPDEPLVPEFHDPPVEQLLRQRPLVRLEELVAASHARLWLFLDDLQEIHSPYVLADINALFRNLPDGLELVVATRRDPPLSLQRLLLAGRLREVRAADLALGRHEIRRLLDDHGVLLDESGLSLLLERTEGWAAAVRLAALTLSVAEDPHAMVQDFASDDGAVADYLAVEILDRLDPAERRVLRVCAVPEQVNAELSIALTGDPGAALLERLYRGNVLLERLAQPGRWYRMHSMLRGYLLAELRRSDPALLHLLHSRTAEWFADHGHVLWAVGHAVASDDSALAVAMLTDHGPTLLSEGKTRLLRRLIDAAGPDVLRNATIRQLETLTELELGQQIPGVLPRPRPSLDVASRHEDDGSAALEALVALQTARLVDRRLSSAALAASDAVTGNGGDGISMLLRQHRGVVLTLTGQLDEADAELTVAYRMAVSSGDEHARLRSMAGLTAVASSRCDFRRTGELAEDALELAKRIGEEAGPDAAFLMLQAAHAAYQGLDHQRAHQLADRALHLSDEVPEPAVRMSATGLRAALDVAVGGDPFEAARHLRDCWSIGAGQPISAVTATRIAFTQHRCSWLVGRPDWAQEAVQRLSDALGASGDLEVLLASEHVARGRSAAARRRLRPVLDGSMACMLPISLQQAWLIEAVLAAEAGEHDHSFAALCDALVVAEELQAMHVFMEVPGVADMLDRNSSRFGRLEPLVDEIRATIGAHEQQGFVPLTPKELQLLTDLPAQLTLEEIADLRQVSVNTVKTHVRSIYQKLGASSRREAIATARRRGLL